MEAERPKARLCLKLGQRKLSFQQQKLQTTSKSQEVSSTTDTHTQTAPQNNNASSTNTSTSLTSTKEEPTVCPAGLGSREIPSLSGLCNLGNTCYVNCLLQLLRFSPGFSKWVGELHELCEQLDSQSGKKTETSREESGCSSANGLLITDEGCVAMYTSESCEVKEEKIPSVCLATHLHNLWQRMSQKEKTFAKPTNKTTVLTATKPDAFVAKLKEENPLFNNKLQQDAQEMLRYTLTNLHETLLTVTKSMSNILKSHGTSLEVGGGRIESEDCVIDVDKYHFESSSHIPGSRKRRLLSPASGRKESKVIKLKLNKNSRTSKNIKVTEFFKPMHPGKGEASSRKELHHKLNSTVRDFITECFQGQVAYQMRCYECDTCTRRTEPFLDVSVPVTSSADILPGFPVEASPCKVEPGLSLLSSTDIGPHSLSWALSQFALREKLRGINKYFCDECGHFVEAERSVLFSHLSSVMTIHLNRFATQTWGLASTVTVNKVGGNLAVPLSLSFKPWCTSDCNGKESVYQLYAVIFHSGSSCGSGHYTACVRVKECKKVAPKGAEESFDGNGWVYFDDDQLEFISQSELLEMMSPLSSSASTVYILFYIYL